MEAQRTIDDIREKVRALKKEGNTIAFVPTMGALHDGHLSLFRLARQHADEVVASIYVNPEQFAPDEDFEEYPRELQDDLKKCEEEGVAAVFAPTDEIMYPGKQYFSIEVDELNEYMDGGSRPGFFEGILLVVNKLFNIVEPDFAVFGQKDIQQFRILQQMVNEFNHDIELLMGPIKRANDGLALSSRNKYLDDEQRKLAPGLYRSLQYVGKQIVDGAKNIELLLNHQKNELEAKGFKIDYLNLFSFEKMKPVTSPESDSKYILAGAVYLGETRLIDNLIIEK
ncbi:pantoate--beta-alanine ligase [Aliifodinibius salipaludis]|uniref:Pantothenate synthetase n=1 Tax=Fodinibius salipaludis TaxID=2032627 RepID=A0A2A2GC33_9BACT|nr:pantoate--beta-alanine ligase [Aliifodinibius salipaludis]PAU94908.1 pantoate--beta-alanine ligase [Aliifodinibius salipaludis]